MSPEKVASFYQIVKDLKKRKKKYINRKYLSTVCTLKENDVGYKMLTRVSKKMNVLTIPEFQKVFAILAIYYLDKECVCNLLTSKKINRFTQTEHLQRKREIKKYLLEQLQGIQHENWGSSYFEFFDINQFFIS